MEKWPPLPWDSFPHGFLVTLFKIIVMHRILNLLIEVDTKHVTFFSSKVLSCSSDKSMIICFSWNGDKSFLSLKSLMFIYYGQDNDNHICCSWTDFSLCWWDSSIQVFKMSLSANIETYKHLIWVMGEYWWIFYKLHAIKLSRHADAMET